MSIQGGYLLTRRMHHAANHKPTARATRQMQSRPIFHTQMFRQPPFRKEIRRQLNGTAKASTDHRRTDAAIEALDALIAIDFAEAVDGVLVIMLRADGEEGGEGLQARLDEEEWRAGCGSKNSRCSAGEDVDAQGLVCGIFVEDGGEALSQGLVEAKATAVQEELVDVLPNISISQSV